MRIVLLEADTLGIDMDLSSFEQFGEFISYGRTDTGDISRRIAEADIIIVNKLPMNAHTLSGAKSLKLICVSATGINNIDLEYVRSRGISVANAAGYSTAMVAQHTFALYFYLAQKMRYYDDFVKSGEYTRCPVFSHFTQPFGELAQKTWGIIGLGSIGKKTAAIASAFGCRVVYYSTTGKNKDPLYQQVDFPTLLNESDVISVHAPLNPDTEDMFNQKAFVKMKNSAVLINVARGPIINESDLYHALTSGEIAGAALDVLSREPMAPDNPLLQLKDSTKLLITPHIGWAGIESRSRLIAEVTENIRSFINHTPRNIVS